jgi:hypothetical protein
MAIPLMAGALAFQSEEIIAQALSVVLTGLFLVSLYFIHLLIFTLS